MTVVQKIIKYLAIAFAFFLIFTIVSSIISFGNAITSLFIDKKPSDVKIVDFDDEIKNLDIKLGASNLIIKKGEVLKVEVDASKVDVIEKDNEIKIEEKNWTFKNMISEIVLYIPEEFKFDDIKIETGAGKLNIENLESDTMNLRLGAGKTVINDINSKNVKIEAGAGELVIKNGKLNDAKVEVGIGKLELTAELTGSSEIETGIGAAIIKLLPTESNYKIEFNKGIGSIKYNDKNINDSDIIGEGTNVIKIKGGIGSIIVNDEEVEVNEK